VRNRDREQIMIGRTIDRYRVVEKLGQGGMGVVYKARDTVLERFVALKVLPPDKSSDPDRRRRFLQEAKSASALNHPGIVAVYDVLTVDDQDVLVMELVDGETLEQLLARKRPSLSESLGLGIEIADALARAHAAGIVHRDLKPSNVMVTADGAKVLDFGLAKLVEAPFLDREAPTVAPDETALTGERVAVGTVGWMAPEQASGDEVDARSDIFAFGVLLYEMLTGQHPFRRRSTLKTLAAICDEEPERPTTLVPALPPEAERAVLRCLNKDPSRRWQSLSDLGAVLQDLKEDTESGRRVVAGPAPGQRRVPIGLVMAGAAVLVAAVVATLLLLPRERSASQTLDLRRLTYDTGASIVPAISPDGNLIAFSSDRGGDGGTDIWVRHINQPEPTRLTDHPADDGFPGFSPDGSRIVFRSGRDGGGIFVVNALGGGLRKIAGRGRFPRFSADGAQIYFAEDPDWAPGWLRRMYRVAVSGGSPEPLVPGWGVRAPPGSAGPILSPDGRLVLFSGAPLDDRRRSDWWVAPVAGGEPWSSGAMENLPRIDLVEFPSVWLPGRLLFIAGTTIEGMNLYQAQISDRGKISGPVEPLTAGPGMSWLPTVSASGRIALSRFQFVIHLWDVALDATTGRALGAPGRITDDASPKFSFSLSRDGDLLAYSTFAGSPDNRRGEVRLQDRASGEEGVPVSLPLETTSLYPRLSGDGSLLSWRNWTDGRWITYVAPTKEPVGRELCEGCLVVDFFSDGSEALVDWGRRLSRLRIADGLETPILEMEEGRALLDTDLSWDDRWLAIQTGEPDGKMAISVAPLREPPISPEEWVEIAGRDVWVGAPRWSPDGNTLYYLSDRDDFICLWAQSLDPDTREPVGDPFSIAHAHTSSMSMMPMSRSMWNLEVGRGRLVFNAVEMTGDVYTAMLEEE
jgi:Tol biopolymer transport system component/predicted Ser/Thr protein kinase